MTELHRPGPAVLDRIRVVLVRPSHPGNIGACARAMRVMGLRDLALVAPRVPEAHRHPDAQAFASGALDLLTNCSHFDSLPEAIADASLVVGLSAHGRAFGPDPQPPEDIARRVFDELEAAPVHRAAIVFGTERTGLSVADAGLCQALCSIPGEPGYCSLNLAQAVQVLAYLLRRESLNRSPVACAPALTGAHAPQTDVAAFFEHFERALVAIRFLDPAHPKKLMARIRRLFGRTRLETEEVQLLRGICHQAELAARGALPPARDRESP